MSMLRFWCICICWQHAVPNTYIENFTSKLNLTFGTLSGICPWPSSPHLKNLRISEISPQFWSHSLTLTRTQSHSTTTTIFFFVFDSWLDMLNATNCRTEGKSSNLSWFVLSFLAWSFRGYYLKSLNRVRVLELNLIKFIQAFETWLEPLGSFAIWVVQKVL